MTFSFNEPVVSKIADFLRGIGLEVVSTTLDGPTFLPGILVDRGRILLDEMKLAYPGDLLHEAGHLALAPGDIRRTLTGEVVLPGVAMEPVEVQAMAWSYAACLHLGLDPKVVFHDGGYRGASGELLFNYSIGVYIGASGLEDLGLTVCGERALQLKTAPFPNMIKWLRD